MQNILKRDVPIYMRKKLTVLVCHYVMFFTKNCSAASANCRFDEKSIFFSFSVKCAESRHGWTKKSRFSLTAITARNVSYTNEQFFSGFDEFVSVQSLLFRKFPGSCGYCEWGKVSRCAHSFNQYGVPSMQQWNGKVTNLRSCQSTDMFDSTLLERKLRPAVGVINMRCL